MLRIGREKLARLSDRMVQAKADAQLKGLDMGKDLLSLLMKSNASEEPHKRLSDAEVRAQVV
jgi:hypothetical protein